MASQLPESLDLEPVAGVRPSTATVTPTDFGLGQAAQEAGQIASTQERIDYYRQRDQQRADLAAVQPYVLKVREANQAGLESDAAAWDGTPGLAQDQFAKAKARASEIQGQAQGLTDGQSRVLGHQLDLETSRLGNAAISAETQRMATTARDQQETRLGDSLTGFQAAWGPAQQTLADSFDGSSPGQLVAQTGEAFDAAAKPVLDAAQPQDKPALQARLAMMKTDAVARAAAADGHQSDAYAKGQILNNTDSLITGVIAHPGTYAQAGTAIDAVIASAPAKLQPALRAEVHDKLNQGYVEGLIQNDQPDAALDVLKGGTLSLKPDVEANLIARANAKLNERKPKTLEEATAQLDMARRAQANVEAIATTGGPAADAPAIEDMVQAFGADKAAEYQAQQTAAYQAHAITGKAQAATLPELEAQASAAAPDPSSATYANDLPIWQATTRAAQQEIALRQKGAGAWAFAAGPALKTGKAGAGHAMALAGRGAALQTQYQGVIGATDPAARAQAAGGYASAMLATQEQAGIPKTAWQIVPQTEAHRLAASVVTAAPESRAQALSAVAALVEALPNRTTAQDGSTVSPRGLLINQLHDAKLSYQDLSALRDFGQDPTGLARFVAAQADPAASRPLDKAHEQALQAAVHAAVDPVLGALSPLVGEDAYRQARTDRTLMVARYLVQTRGLSPAQAAQAAAGDLTQGYVLANGQRIPAAVANAPVMRNPIEAVQTALPMLSTGAREIQFGQARIVSDLVAGGGQKLFAPAGYPGAPDQQRAQLALAIQHGAKWVTSADGATSTLMLPAKSGGFVPVADRFGKPVTASWSQIQAQADHTKPSLFGQPAPGTLHTEDGQPVPAMSLSKATATFQKALVGTESGGRNGLVSPKGALGTWQVMPKTAEPYAIRLTGAPLDEARLQSDPAYNARFGQAILGDAMRQFGGDPVLAAAAYNAGPGALTGYVDKATGQRHPGWLYTIGDPRKGQISHADFVKRIPYPETRAYVGALAQRFSRLALQQ